MLLGSIVTPQQKWGHVLQDTPLVKDVVRYHGQWDDFKRLVHES